MVSISLCMIVKDEETVLARCLDSVQGIADEIIIVDTGSSDQTRAIASQYGRVLDFAWCKMCIRDSYDIESFLALQYIAP